MHLGLCLYLCVLFSTDIRIWNVLTHSINAVVGARLWSESSYKIVLEVLTAQATDANSQITCSLTQAFLQRFAVQMWLSDRTRALDTTISFWFVLDADFNLGSCNLPNVAEMLNLSIPTYG